MTPLHFAAQYGRLSVVEYLVNHGAQLNPRDNSQRTPLGIAAQSCKNFLLQRGGTA